MRFSLLLAGAATLGALTLSLPATAGSDAGPDSDGTLPPLPHAEPLPPPDSLKPDAAALEDSAQSMAQDTPVAMGGISVVCTGTGSSKDDMAWQAYPVRIAFSNAAAQFLSGMHVRLAEDGKTMADFTCWAPWVLVKAPAGGSYKVTATLAGRANSPVKSAAFVVPSSGQKRVNIAFPEIKANE